MVTNSQGFCSHFNVITGNANTQGIRFVNSNGYGYQIQILKTIASTPEELIDWLTNNTVKVYYRLSTPTTTEITDTTLIGQLENILKMHTNKNVTNFSIVPTGTNAEPTAEVEYRVDLETVIGNIQTAILSL
jgi:hypothetical protein